MSVKLRTGSKRHKSEKASASAEQPKAKEEGKEGKKEDDELLVTESDAKGANQSSQQS